MPDRRAPAPAVVHGIARRLLVFKLPDQLAFCFAESAGDIGLSATAASGGRPGRLVRKVTRCSFLPRSCKETSTSTSWGSHLPRCSPSVDNVSKYVRAFLLLETRTYV